MAVNIFDDQETLEGMAIISEEINARAAKENKNEDEIIQEMKTLAFENIRQIIEEEIKENQKIKLSEKYPDIEHIFEEVYITALYIRSKGLAMCDGERKSA
jgi:predicted type IV restriction endonuclease